MANARNTDFTLVDYTEEINLYPKVWSLISGMNMFENHPITGDICQIEFVQETLADIEARKRGGERNFIGSENAITKNLNTAFYPLDRGLKPADYLNFREYGTGNTNKSLLNSIDRIMKRIRSSHAQKREKAMAAAIQGIGLDGQAPGIDYNYYTEFSKTQSLAPVDFTDLTTNPADTIEKLGRRVIIRAAQDGTDSHAAYRIATICGEDWFSAFIGHPEVEEAYKYFADSEQNLLRKRLGMNSEDDSVRVFKYKGVTYIEDLSGNFAADEAFILPIDFPEMFRQYISPSDDLPDVAGEGGSSQELYLWYKENKFDRQYKIESECSFLCVNTRPELCVKSVATI